MKILFLPLLMIAALASCASQMNIRADFDNDFKTYNEKVRWHQFDDIVLFTSDSIAGKFKERTAAAKNVVVTDYRVIYVKYEEENKESEAKVEIDYYTPSFPRVRTVVDNQKWAFQIKGGKGTWKLISLMPEFP